MQDQQVFSYIKDILRPFPDVSNHKDIFTNIKTAICGKKTTCELGDKDCIVRCNITKKAALWVITLVFLFSVSSCEPAFSSQIVKIAQQEIGHGEQGGDNQGRYVRLYLNGKERLPWCAGFVSYVLSKANIDEFGYELSARAFYNKARKLGLITQTPQPGDLIVFWRESKDSFKGHIGIVETINNQRITTIEGNVGKYPAKVKRFEYTLGKIPKLLGFVRASRLVLRDASL